jgi:extracellular elastinolytic metalloproteinase
VPRSSALILALAVAVAAAASAAGDPLQIGLDHLEEQAPALGLSAADLDDLLITDHYRSEHNGVTHVFLRQRWMGLEIDTANGAVHVMADGSILALHHADLLRGVAGRNRDLEIAPVLSPIDAVVAAADALGLAAPRGLRVVEETLGSVDRRVVLTDGEISREEIPVRLMWVPDDKGRLALAWDLSIDDRTSEMWWSLRVDATTGEVLRLVSWTNHAQYRVYPLPVESPNHTSPLPPGDGRVLVTDPHDTTASPFGWHDTNGVPGAEFTTTEGNNVHAYTDVDANNIPDPGSSPDGGASLVFDFPLDLTQAPSAYRPAAVTNLFYWNNIMHDVFYRYGFTEPAGNFQVNNYGLGGLGNDSLRAEAQDGGGTNNANFSTPPDGSRPRMQMYIWNLSSPNRDGDLDSGIIAHEYFHGISQRLTGGPGTVSCLSNSEQMGEGWSDFASLVMGVQPHHTPTTKRGVGTYALNQPIDGQGIRAFPYSADMTIDPRTYQMTRTAAVPHGVGSIWAAIIWEVYWALAAEHGFNPDIWGHWSTGGNNLAIQLVMDGMKLQPCSPGFVTGRNAILQADLALTGGANQCILWQAFAKRGLGFSASQGSSATNSDNTEAFDLPPACEYLDSPAVAAELCSGSVLVLPITLGGGFTPDVTLVAAAVPPMTGATFGFATNPVTTVPDLGNALSIGNTGGVSAGPYSVTVTATDSSVPAVVDDLSFDVTVIAGLPSTGPAPTSPGNFALDVPTAPTFTWAAAAGASGYSLEIDDEPTFAPPLVHAASAILSTSYSYPASLDPNTTYYWRVTPDNACGQGAVSSTFRFTTKTLTCVSPGLPIPDNSPGTGAVSTINVADPSSILDLDVVLGISHTWVGDLVITLTSPNGTVVTLFDRPGVPGSTFGCSSDNINAVADDEAILTFENHCNPSNPAYNPGEHYQPNQPLAAFDGMSLAGAWMLRVTDHVSSDTGTLNSWCLAPASALSSHIFSDGFASGSTGAWSASVP